MAVRSLAGRVVLVTRPPEQSAELSGMLLEREAKVISAPAIELVSAPRRTLDQAAKQLAAGTFEWALFTSRAGVDALASALARVGKRFPEVPGRLAAVGEGTARALESFGGRPDLVPSTYTTSALARAMPRGNGRVLLARADIAPGGLEEALVRKGWTPVRVDAYGTRFASRLPGEAARALRDGVVDAVTFTSASTVRGFMAMARRLNETETELPRAVCIGPVTAEAARRAGFRVVGVARPHTINGLVVALERSLRPRKRKES
jgi:uroporphyrinogen-III synthase/uroporphyrinogen III methyltransferase/synthase